MGKGSMITRPKADLRRGGQGASAQEEQRNRERESRGGSREVRCGNGDGVDPREVGGGG